jgi:hypothetical protein
MEVRAVKRTQLVRKGPLRKKQSALAFAVNQPRKITEKVLYRTKDEIKRQDQTQWELWAGLKKNIGAQKGVPQSKVKRILSARSHIKVL